MEQNSHKYNISEFDLKVMKYLMPEFAAADVMAVPPRAGEMPHTNTLLSLSDKGNRELYAMAGLEAKTGLTYEETLDRGYELEVFVSSFIAQDLWSKEDRAEVFVNLVEPVMGAVVGRGNITDISPEEQALLNNNVVAQIGKRKDCHSIEKFLGDRLGFAFIRQLCFQDPSVDTENRTLSVNVIFQTEAQAEALFRSNAAASLGIESYDEYCHYNYDVRFEAVMTPEGRVRVTGKGEGLDNTAIVPLTAFEERMLAESFGYAYGKFPKEFIDDASVKKPRNRDKGTGLGM